MDRLLVTGGAGFIGCNFVHHLMAHTDVQVTVLDKLTYAASREALEGCPATASSWSSATSPTPRSSTRSSPSTTRWCTSPPSHTTTTPWTTRAPSSGPNLVGTFTILEAVRKAGTVCTTCPPTRSTAISNSTTPSASPSRRPTTRAVPTRPPRPGSDHLVRAWVRSFGVHATISNCSNNYGPWQHIEKFIPRQITNVIDGDRPKLYGAGLNVRDWIHADDHSSAVWTILNEGRAGETYLVGADGEQNNLNVVRMILRHFGRAEDDFEHVTDRAGHDLRYAIDSSKLRAELGGRPFSDFESGLAKTIEWYRDTRTGGGRTSRSPRRRTRRRASDDAHLGEDADSGSRGRPLDVHEDSRGWFKENWQREKMTALGLPDFGPVQNNISFNAARGATPRHPHRAVGQVRRGRDRAGSSRPGSTCAKASTSAPPSTSRSTPASPSSSPWGRELLPGPSTTAPPTPTWSTSTGGRAPPTRLCTSPTRPSPSRGRSRGQADDLRQGPAQPHARRRSADARQEDASSSAPVGSSGAP